MSDSAATRKQLKIKAGVVKRFVALLALSRRYRFDSSSPITRRYQKDLALYRAEVVENQRKLQSFPATTSTDGEGGGGSWDVRNAVREKLRLFPALAQVQYTSFVFLLLSYGRRV
jgi:hypothetical protein